MKKYLGIMLLFLFLNCFAQSQVIFTIDSIPQQGILLNQGWKWHEGDNPDFAKPDFDDSAWESIDPTKDIFDLPQLPKNGEIFWLRLRLAIDSSINQHFVMMLQQSGASVIYFNGRPTDSIGILSKTLNSIRAYSPLNQAFDFPLLNNPGQQTLAIRYTFQPHLKYGTHFASTNKVFVAELMSIKVFGEKSKLLQLQKYSDVLVFSIHLLLSILFFTIYLLFRQSPVNLLFSIYAGINTFAISFAFNEEFRSFLDNKFWVSNLLVVLGITANLFLLLAIYKLLTYKNRTVFIGLSVFGLICIVLSYTIYQWGWVAYGIGFNIALNLEILRVAVLGILRQKKGAWIIATGCFLFLTFWLLFLFGASIGLTLIEYGPYFYAIAQLCVPISVAIFLGYDFAQTNISLKQKVKEIEALSEEKQQILAIQNETLERQVESRTMELNKSLTDLKSTQTQLIQSEKMASLGELTAGIAHEIQNPLNFVNNFSEVTKELVEELETEGNKENGERDKGLEKELFSDIKENLTKINHHGNRASSIVKGMLEHSRTSTGQKELTDINALADEYLRLAYHGLRAKDRSFNADFKSDFDPNLPKVEVVPQDIGRVILNLINNAFQAVGSEGIKNPTVTVRTERVASPLGVGGSAESIQITVLDNGPGIPDAIKDKIFQPFFTTKPTGQGTGLGLSLSYDIVKAHGGELKVESVEGEGTKFIVLLPV